MIFMDYGRGLGVNIILYHTSMKYCNLIGPLQMVYFTYTRTPVNVKASPTFCACDTNSCGKETQVCETRSFLRES